MSLADAIEVYDNYSGVDSLPDGNRELINLAKCSVLQYQENSKKSLEILHSIDSEILGLAISSLFNNNFLLPSFKEIYDSIEIDKYIGISIVEKLYDENTRYIAEEIIDHIGPIYSIADPLIGIIKSNRPRLIEIAKSVILKYKRARIIVRNLVKSLRNEKTKEYSIDILLECGKSKNSIFELVNTFNTESDIVIDYAKNILINFEYDPLTTELLSDYLHDDELFQVIYDIHEAFGIKKNSSKSLINSLKESETKDNAFEILQRVDKTEGSFKIMVDSLSDELVIDDLSEILRDSTSSKEVSKILVDALSNGLVVENVKKILMESNSSFGLLYNLYLGLHKHPDQSNNIRPIIESHTYDFSEPEILELINIIGVTPDVKDICVDFGYSKILFNRFITFVRKNEYHSEIRSILLSYQPDEEYLRRLSRLGNDKTISEFLMPIYEHFNIELDTSEQKKAKSNEWFLLSKQRKLEQIKLDYEKIRKYDNIELTESVLEELVDTFPLKKVLNEYLTERGEEFKALIERDDIYDYWSEKKNPKVGSFFEIVYANLLESPSTKDIENIIEKYILGETNIKSIEDAFGKYVRNKKFIGDITSVMLNFNDYYFENALPLFFHFYRAVKTHQQMDILLNSLSSLDSDKSKRAIKLLTALNLDNSFSNIFPLIEKGIDENVIIELLSTISPTKGNILHIKSKIPQYESICNQVLENLEKRITA